MANGRLIISHNGVVFEPPLEEGVQIEWERTGSPGKLTFKTVKTTNDMVFQEGDPVGFYYDNKLVFAGYVFSKKCEREHFIDVTCYDQLRYLKNKYTYVFEKKTATQIIKSLCNDFSLQCGTFDDTKYVIPAIVEENKAALDIILDVVEETLVNTGEMYVLYDDGGKLQLKNVADLASTTLICEETAENFDYSSSIDGETYNEVVLYYDANSKSTSSNNSNKNVDTSNQAQAILDMAKSQIGTAENPMGTRNVKYNTEYYGREINTSSEGAYHWCCVFVWWVFKECGLSSLLYDGEKINNQQTLAMWFSDKGDLHRENFKPGDVVFFNWDGGRLDHVGFVESVDGNNVTCIEGNVSGVVKRVVRNRECIQSVGRPRYTSAKTTTPTETSSESSSWGNSIQLYTAYSPSKIKEWGLLRYFEKVDTPSIGQNKANALLQLYNRKTRELKVTGAFGDIKVRGGTLLPVKLNLGDVEVSNFMLVEKVKHKFDNDHHTMDLTLQGAWGDSTNDMLSQTIGELPTEDTTSTTPTDTTTSSGNGGSSGDKKSIYITCNGIDAYAGKIQVGYTENGVRKRVSVSTIKKGSSKVDGAMGIQCDAGTTTSVKIVEKTGQNFVVSAVSGSSTNKARGEYYFKMNTNASIVVKWIAGRLGNKANGNSGRV